MKNLEVQRTGMCNIHLKHIIYEYYILAQEKDKVNLKKCIT